jgi:hypothetical protein
MFSFFSLSKNNHPAMDSPEKQQYRVLCNQKKIPLFMQAWWMDAVCTGGKQWDVFLYEQNNLPIAAMPYHVRKKYGFRFLIMPQLTFFNGIWTDEQTITENSLIEQKIIPYFVQRIQSLKPLYFQQNFGNGIPYKQILQQAGFRPALRHTYIIENMNDMKAVFNRFHPSKQRHVRKAQRAELSVERNLSCDRFAELFVEQYLKKGKQPYFGTQFIRTVSQTAIDRGQGAILAATDGQGVVQSALFVVWDSFSAYNLLLYIREESRSNGASTWIFYKAIEYLADKTQRFDFEGSMIPSVADSYRRFGAVKTDYWAFEKHYSRWFKMLLQRLR